MVTVHYSDGTSAVTNVYTLSGTLTEGTSTITVTYGTLTTTFSVTVTASPVPAGYTPLQYVERPSNATTSQAYNDTGFKPNGTDDLLVHIGCELLGTPSSSSGGYFFACRQYSGQNSVGFGVFSPQSADSMKAFDGTSATIEPEGSGVSVKNHQYDLTVTKTPTTLSITDGTHSNTVTRTPRAMGSNIYLFGFYGTDSILNVPLVGRIYYLDMTEGDTLKLNLIPCKRNSDSAIGFWDSVSETFLTNAYYTAGPVL